MINRVISFSVRNKFLVFALVGMACLWGAWAMMHLPLDATPDLSETQVIIVSRWDRSPDIIEDQVTYPIISTMTGAPRVKAVRGISDFGFSYVYVVFDEGTDIYWARSRALEYLAGVTGRLPEGVKTEIGPDATGWGGIPVCAERRVGNTQPGRAPLLSGLVPEVLPESSAGCSRCGLIGRIHTAVPGQCGS